MVVLPGLGAEPSLPWTDAYAREWVCTGANRSNQMRRLAIDVTGQASARLWLACGLLPTFLCRGLP